MQDKPGWRKRAGRPSDNKSKRPTSRVSDEFKAAFKDRQSQKDSFATNRSNVPPRQQKREAPPDNVSLYLSDKMLELATELADEAQMPLRLYLVDALKYVLLAQANRTGKREKYLAEFVSQNRRQVKTWKPGGTGK